MLEQGKLIKANSSRPLHQARTTKSNKIYDNKQQNYSIFWIWASVGKSGQS